ncbi:unnamed protein product [Symbiodinium pilosum]|uniref:Phosphatidic acid phosphatase type 2/haloperoxidase domain-containing protein n=1 Tax=Symbiodinium pilosum TaxID=2952 RepID=A0A812UFJ4_SYMPI|nr:unnamed protein product [Symbiodinium pilosum]
MAVLLGAWLTGSSAETCLSDETAFLQRRDDLVEDSQEDWIRWGRYRKLFKDNGMNYDLRNYTDEDGTVYLPWMFSKTLEHDPKTGFAKKSDIDLVLAAETDPTLDNVESIVLSSNTVRKLEGLTTTRNRNDLGKPPQLVEYPFFYEIDTEESAFEMAEVYCQALLRDVAFFDYGSDSKAALCIQELNKFSSKTSAPTNANGMIDAQTLFRGPNPGELEGPYMSQFLVKSFRYGNLEIDQKYVVEEDPNNMLTMAGWLQVQNGEVPTGIVTNGKAFASNGRVLGSMVHRDPLYQFYYNAALLALQQGISTDGLHLTATSAWTTTGPPDVFAAVGHVALGALRTAWWQKWGIYMRIRPEVYAKRYELARKHPELVSEVPGLANLKAHIEKADLLIEEVLKENELASGVETALLDMQYPEGSPTHPSLPAGHAVVAGACVTVLKAMLKTFDDDKATIETKWVTGSRTAWHSIDGQTLVEYTEPDSSEMTVNGELNKLASNVALGRDFAGVHYRADGDGGILAGEDYAISYLADKLKSYREADKQYQLFDGWVLQKFDGTVVRITHKGAEPLSKHDVYSRENQRKGWLRRLRAKLAPKEHD